MARTQPVQLGELTSVIRVQYTDAMISSLMGNDPHVKCQAYGDAEGNEDVGGPFGIEGLIDKGISFDDDDDVDDQEYIASVRCFLPDDSNQDS